MLGILLDNAIEAASADYINVYLLCSEYSLIIKVSNEYDGIVEESKIFNKQYSTNSKKRGYGLYNLKKL